MSNKDRLSKVVFEMDSVAYRTPTLIRHLRMYDSLRSRIVKK